MVILLYFANAYMYNVNTDTNQVSYAGCLIVYPSSYSTADGKLHQYQWTNPLQCRDDLQAIPPWLITIINSGDKRASEDPVSYPSKRRQVALPSSAYQTLTMEVVQKKSGNQVARTWPRPGGYDFSQLDEQCPCGICGNVHSSNHFIVRRIISTCFKLANYSSRCKKVLVCGDQDVRALKDLAEAPTSDDRIVRILELITKDVGCALVYTSKQWLWFQGLIWEPISDIEVKHRLKKDVNYGVVETLKKCLSLSGVRKDEGDAGRLLTALEKCNKFLMKAGNINSVAETAKHLLLDESIASQLDTNKDVIAAANGVIDLQTGVLRKALQQDHLSRYVHTDYQGLDYPTPMIDSLFASIFNDDTEVISYMQRLLGYGITGHISNHKWAIWIGAGGNGKSLLLDCISNLLGPDMFCTPPKEVFFQSGRQGSAGGHTAHLQPLINKLICAREESNDCDVLDQALIKQCTGESLITSRAPYSSEYTTFMPTHLPILCCNALPKINVDDDGTLRRLIVVPFLNTYVSPSDRTPYDPQNPHHRLKDPTLRDKLNTESGKQQLLTWLVKGARDWFAGGKDLGEQPALLKNRLEQYIADNDVLRQFIQDQCEVGKEYKVKKDEFQQAFMQASGRNVKQSVLEVMMTKRGFAHKQAKIGGKQMRVYSGIRLGDIFA